jgi:hypothetical protein
MTMAICVRCGDEKRGAFVPCPGCGRRPRTDDELALALALTDHHQDPGTLQRIGAAVKSGAPIRLDPETRDRMVGVIRQCRAAGLLSELLDGGEPASG